MPPGARRRRAHERGDRNSDPELEQNLRGHRRHHEANRELARKHRTSSAGHQAIERADGPRSFPLTRSPTALPVRIYVSPTPWTRAGRKRASDDLARALFRPRVRPLRPAARHLESGETQAELARKAGVTEAYISMLESTELLE